MDQIQFDDSKHTYFFQLPTGRRIIPSVTSILKAVYPTTWEIDPYFGDKGKKIHRAIQLLLNNSLDESTVDPIIMPYLKAFESWRDMSWAKIHDFEKIVYCAHPEYAGRFDATFDIGGKVYLLDFKSGGPLKTHAPQVALYGNAHFEKEYAACRLALLYLKKDGKFSFKPLTLPEQMEALDAGLRAVESYYQMQDNLFEVKA